MSRAIKEGYNSFTQMYWMEDPLSEEEYAEAKANGVSRVTAYSRRHLCGWSKHDTVNVRLRGDATKSKVRKKYKERRIALGISEYMFDSRVFDEGIDPEVFLSTPELHKKKKAPQRKYAITEEQYKIAEANGIPRKRVQNRLSSKNKAYDVERAITEPVGIYPTARRHAK